VIDNAEDQAPSTEALALPFLPPIRNGEFEWIALSLADLD
jgi:hypothetical protein